MSSVVPTLLEQVAALQELDRRECFADPCVAMERHFSIEEPDGTVIPLRLWDFQREAITALHDGGLVIVLKARRLGLSWIYLAYALWLAIVQPGVRVLILCKTEGDASELLDRIRRMKERLEADPASAHLLAGLPEPKKSRDHVTALDVGTSTIKALVGTPAAARSETAGLVLLDEFAFQRKAGEIWRAILPTAEGGGRVGAISTGNGGPDTAADGAEFAKQWTAANAGLNDFAGLFFPWQCRPDRDEAWKARTLAMLGDEERFKTEYPETPQDAFVAPDVNLVFDTAAIDAAVRLGAKLDAEREAGTIAPPVGDMLAAGVDWGDFRTHAIPVWELERGGLYLPPGEVQANQADVEDITRLILAAVGQYDFWFGEERYDASFKQSNRTFARTAEAQLGPHNPFQHKGRPNTVPVAFGTYKSLTVAYLRMLLRRTLGGEETRVLAISPENTILISQLRAYEQADDGKFVKGNDDAVDSLIAGAAPVAKRHRAHLDDTVTD